MNKKGIALPLLLVIIMSIGLLFTGIYTYFSGLNKKIMKKNIIIKLI